MDIFHSLDWLFTQNFQLIADVTNTINGSSIELEMLKKCMTFLDSANKNFNDTISHLETFLLIFIAAIVAILGGSLWTTRDKVREFVNDRVKEDIAKIVNNKTNVLEKIIEKESVISKTSVKYFLSGDYQGTEESKLLKNRKFEEVEFINKVKKYKNSKNAYNVLIVDFINKDFVSEKNILNKTPEEEKKIIEEGREEIISSIILLIKTLSLQPVLVIYVPSPPKIGLHGKIYQLLDSNNIYYIPANSPVSLIGRVVDAAQMAYALQHGKSS